MTYIPWQKTIGGLKHYPVSDHDNLPGRYRKEATYTRKEAEEIARHFRPKWTARIFKLKDAPLSRPYMVYVRLAGRR